MDELSLSSTGYKLIAKASDHAPYAGLCRGSRSRRFSADSLTCPFPEFGKHFERTIYNT